MYAKYAQRGIPYHNTCFSLAQISINENLSQLKPPKIGEIHAGPYRRLSLGALDPGFRNNSTKKLFLQIILIIALQNSEKHHQTPPSLPLDGLKKGCLMGWLCKKHMPVKYFNALKYLTSMRLIGQNWKIWCTGSWNESNWKFLDKHYKDTVK